MLKMFYIYRCKQNMYIVSQRVLMQQLHVDEYLDEYLVLYDLFGTFFFGTCRVKGRESIYAAIQELQATR